MQLTEEQVKEAIEKSKSYSGGAKRFGVSRQRLWVFCQRHDLSIQKNSKAIARLIPTDIRKSKKGSATLKIGSRVFIEIKLRKNRFNA